MLARPLQELLEFFLEELGADGRLGFHLLHVEEEDAAQVHVHVPVLQGGPELAAVLGAGRPLLEGPEDTGQVELLNIGVHKHDPGPKACPTLERFPEEPPLASKQLCCKACQVENSRTVVWRCTLQTCELWF